MDIDIQTLIQQDIDLGIKKSLNYDFELANVNDPTFGSTSTGEFEFLKYLNENSSSAKMEPVADFYLRQQLEIQKNDDILMTTNLFDNESIPDGYKLVVEEDTGECFLILIRNDSMSDPSNSVSSEHANLDAEWGNFSQVIAASRANQTQPMQETKSLSESESESTDDASSLINHEEFNIQVKFSVFLKDEAINLLHEEYHKSESKIEKTTGAEPKDTERTQNIPFLSQTSVNNELDKLDTTQEQVNPVNPTTSHNNNNNILNSLNESLNGFDNLLDDVWVNNILSSDDVGDQNQIQQPQTEIRNEDFLIDDKMLSTLNSNSTIMNETNLIHQLTNNNNNNTSLLIDNLENYLPNDEQTFDLLFGDNVLVENQLDEIKTETITPSSSNLQEENLAYTFDQFEQILIKNANEFETTSTLISSSNQISFNNHHDADNKNTNNDKAISKAVQFQPLLNMDLTLKQEAVDVEDKILVSDLAQEQLPAALNGLRHNHTYLSTSNSQSDLEQTVDLHPYSYKSKMRKMQKNLHASNEANSEQMRKNQSKDMALLRELKIDLTLEQIVDTNADEFGELLKANNLTPEQVNLIKDIRRRAKNKVAAQICRKRKLDSIDSLKEQVDQLKQMKSNLLSEFNSIQGQIKSMTNKFDDLYKNAIGSSYDTNDPIVAFIKNLKDYNPNANNRNVNGARKTYDSNNSSDLDSDNSNSASPKYGKSSILNDLNEDYDEDEDYEDDDDDDEDELFDDDDDQDELDDASDQDEPLTKSSSTAKKPSQPAANKYKKFKRNHH